MKSSEYIKKLIVNYFIIFAAQIAVIYGFVRFLSWMDDRKTADIINEKLNDEKVIK